MNKIATGPARKEDAGKVNNVFPAVLGYDGAIR